MKKYLLSLFLLGAASFNAFSEGQSTLEFTYAEGDVMAFGKGKKENIDVAMCLNDPSLVGMKIKAIKAYISTVDGIEDASLWMSGNLVLQNKVNVPDIASYETTPVATTLNGDPLGLLQVSLNDPYVITDSPLYIGYSISVTAVDTPEEKKPIIYSSGANPNGLFLHMSKSVLKWMDYSDNVGGVAFIVIDIEGEFAPVSVGVSGYKPIYAMDNENFNAEIILSNKGESAAEKISYVYSFDDSDQEFEGSVTLDTPLPSSLSATSPVTLSFNGVEGMGKHILHLSITQVNGNDNESTSPSIDAVVNVIPFMPQHRPLIEEYTGLWCGWCPGGYIAMEKIAEVFGDDQVSICYHNGDPMEVTTNYPMNITGFPSLTIDRTSLVADPYYGNTDENFGVAYSIEDAMDALAIAAIDVEAELTNETVEVTSSVTFIQDIDESNYQIGYVLLADGLTSESWYQTNYFTDQGGYAGSDLEQLTKLPKKIGGWLFNDVAIDVSEMLGVEGSIPVKITAAEEYNNAVTFDIKDNSLVQNKENLKVAAYVINKDNGFIVNANKASVKAAGIQGISGADKELKSRAFYDLSGRKLTNPAKGIYIIKEIYKDGTFKTIKAAIR